MRLFSKKYKGEAPYAPIFDVRLLFGMSLFSSKYSTHTVKKKMCRHLCQTKNIEGLAAFKTINSVCDIVIVIIHPL